MKTSHQVRGHGGLLMNQLKELCKRHFGSMYFLTYADNFAVGYFERQGFSTTIQLPEVMWKGYIKDYDGGTLMGCPLYQHVEYRDFKSSARNVLVSVVSFLRDSKPLEVYKPNCTFPIQPQNIEGLNMDVWKPSTEWTFRSVNLHAQINSLLLAAMSLPCSLFFRDPVNERIAPGYFSVVSTPMDLSTMRYKNDHQQYKSSTAFTEDAELLNQNSATYNGPRHDITKQANELVVFLTDGARMLVEYAY